MDTTLSPDFKKVPKVFDIAAIPDAKLVAASASSNSFTLSSKALTVGLVFREYICPSTTPKAALCHISMSL